MRWDNSAFADSIGDVVALSTKKEMVRADAHRIVALVTDVKAFIKCAVFQIVGKASGKPSFAHMPRKFALHTP